MNVENVEKVVFKFIELISKDPYESWVYNTYDDDSIYVKINFSPVKVSLKETSLESRTDQIPCIYKGTIHLKINKLSMKFNDEWEDFYYKDDLTESGWDELIEYIDNELFNYISQVCVEIKISF